jgi:hypothetical protein
MIQIWVIVVFILSYVLCIDYIYKIVAGSFEFEDEQFYEEEDNNNHISNTNNYYEDPDHLDGFFF